MRILKLLLAALLLLCLFSMPYGYYNIVRIVSMIGFSIIAYRYYSEKEIELFIVFCGLVLLFQPFVKVPLGRTIWNITDMIVAGILLYLSFFYHTKSK